jgi:hypothetical protein
MRFAAAIGLAVAVLFSAPHADASCIGNTAQQTASAIGAVPSGALVVAAPLESDVAPLANRGDELALRVASLVAGKIAGAHVAPHASPLEEARAKASRSAELVYVTVQIMKSQMRVTVDVYPVVRNVWDRARLPPPPPVAHAYAAAPIDAEVRAFFPSIPLELTSIHKATHGEGDVVAAACGDIDGDGEAEILLATRDHVSLGRVRSGKVAIERSVSFAALAKRAPVPLREPLAGASIELGRALVGISDRGGVSLDESLGAAHALAGIPFGAGICAPIAPSRSAFEGPGVSCDADAPPPNQNTRESFDHQRDSAGAFDAASAFDLVSQSGTEAMAIATREGGKIRLRVGGAERASFDGAGAQVAVLDANLDGAPEIAFSNDVQENANDAITIVTIEEKGPRVLARLPAPNGVRALAACPSQNGGGAELVAVVGNEVWIVR